MSNKRGGGGVTTMNFEHPDGFNPNADLYKSCCCHTKTATIVLGIFEIFTICFLLVAVLPDVTTRVCDHLENSTDLSEVIENFELENIRNIDYMNNILCHNNITCLVWALIQVTSILSMFYGVKTNRWFLFIPHFLFRIVCIILVALVDAWIIYRAAADDDNMPAYVTTIIVFALFELGIIYSTWVEIRCAHFVKRSRDTGFSISIARPVGPATISLSENPPQPVAPEHRRLPPLRHTRNQYIVSDPHLPVPGNPNETNQ